MVKVLVLQVAVDQPCQRCKPTNIVASRQGVSRTNAGFLRYLVQLNVFLYGAQGIRWPVSSSTRIFRLDR